MTQAKSDRPASPVQQQLDPEVHLFRAQFDQKSPLDELAAKGLGECFNQRSTLRSKRLSSLCVTLFISKPQSSLAVKFRDSNGLRVTRPVRSLAGRV
jgi:hypothetical protein